MKNEKKSFPLLLIAQVLLLIIVSMAFGYILHDSISNSSDLSLALREMQGLIENRYYFYDDKTSDALILGALDGMAYGMDDPYAKYYTAEEYDEELKTDSGDYVGIGISVGVPDDIGSVVYSVYEGSSAYKAGIKVHDVITMVNGHEAANVSLDTLMGFFTADEITPNEITVLRDEDELQFVLYRSAIHIKRVKYEMLEPQIGYLQITEFTGSVAKDFNDAMGDLLSQGATGVVIDLRDNPGGTLDDVLQVADLIIPTGKTIATIKSKSDKASTYRSDGKEQFACSYAVLVNGGSASASELLTGALKDHGLATIVGTQTYGKGIVQTYYRLNSTAGWLKLTTDAYYTPNDVCIHNVGITPDIVIEQDKEYENEPVNMIPRGKDIQLQAALDALKQVDLSEVPAA